MPVPLGAVHLLVPELLAVPAAAVIGSWALFIARGSGRLAGCARGAWLEVKNVGGEIDDGWSGRGRRWHHPGSF